jgi:hypothetical protein
MSETTFIYENHWGGGSTRRWIVDKYLVSATFSTGSSIYVESLDFPGPRESGWFYMMESPDECVARLISKLKYRWEHACWRVDSKQVKTEGGGFYTTYGSIKYIDHLTEEKIKEIEADPNFNCWEYINTYKWGKFVTKTVYNPNKFTYEKLPHEDIKSC